MLSEKLANLAAGLAATVASRRGDDDLRNMMDAAVELLRGYAVEARALERHTVPPAARVVPAHLPANAISIDVLRARRASTAELPCDTEPGGAA